MISFIRRYRYWQWPSKQLVKGSSKQVSRIHCSWASLAWRWGTRLISGRTGNESASAFFSLQLQCMDTDLWFVPPPPPTPPSRWNIKTATSAAKGSVVTSPPPLPPLPGPRRKEAVRGLCGRKAKRKKSNPCCYPLAERSTCHSSLNTWSTESVLPWLLLHLPLRL